MSIKAIYTVEGMLDAKDRSNLWKRRALEAELLLESEEAEDEDDAIKVESIPELIPKSMFLNELSDWLDDQKVSRKIRFINCHATGTPSDTTATSIDRYWRNNLGWKNPGYHVMVHADGSYTIFADLQMVTNGVRGVNFKSINVSYIGGVLNGDFVDTRTKLQKSTYNGVIKLLKLKFPQAKIMGHRDHPNVTKACPCFDAIEEFSNINI